MDMAKKTTLLNGPEPAEGCAVGAALAPKSFATTFCNPLNLNYAYRVYEANGPVCIEGADPVVVLFRDEYYLFSSVTEGYWVSSDLATWRFIPCTKEQLPGIELYAPAVMVMDDAVYWHQGCYQKTMYRSTNPKDPGAWEVVSTHCDMHHDPDMFYDRDTGKVWMSYGCGDTKTESMSGQELSRSTLEPVGEAYHCFKGNQIDHGWERVRDNHTDVGWGYTEGSQLFKYRGLWYLVYSGDSLYKGYANGAYTAPSPTGPYAYVPSSPVAHKNTGFIGGAGHGYFFQDRYGNWWNVTCGSVYVSHAYERRINLYPAGIDTDGQLYTITTLGDYPITLPTGPRAHTRLQLAGWMLLSKGAKARASSEAVGPARDARYGEGMHETQGVLQTKHDHRAQYAADDDIRTLWSAASDREGEWFELDLGRLCTVHAVQVNFAEYNIENLDPAAKYHAYRLEYSIDGASWRVLVDKWNNTTHVPHDYLELITPAKTRWIRVVNRHMPGNGWFALRDLRVFGNDGGPVPVRPGEFSVTRHGDRLGATLQWAGVERAEGYVVRYGIEADKLYNQYQVDGTTVEVRTLNAGVDYCFRVDAFNANGYSEGTLVKRCPSSL